MPEYIERKPRYIDIKKVTIPRGFFNQDLNVPKIFDLLYSQPTADVVEVVRCKYCKENLTGDVQEGTIWCHRFHARRPLDGFCHYGERKEGG